jgi:uroporphyrinogen decarboxylase
MGNTVSTTGFEPYKGEPDKERLIAAYLGEQTDRVPNFEVLIEDEHITKMLGRSAGNTLSVGGDVAKGADKAGGEVRPMLPADYIDVCRIIGQDAICVESMWTPIRQRKPDGSVVMYFDRSLSSRADMDRIIWPGEDDLEKTIGYIREYKEAVEGTKIGVILASACLFQTLYEFVIGLEDCMVMAIQEQDIIEELMTKSADYYAELHRRAIAEGIDILFVADDFAFNGGLFLPPDIFEKLWRPHMAKVIQPAIDAGVPVKFHSDGKLDEAMEMLIGMGINCINPMDPYGIDYRDYKKRYGSRVTFSGNIDIEFPLVRGTTEDVEDDVKAHCQVMMKGGRWEAGSSHSIVNYIPHENFITMINAVHKYGVY